MSGLKTTLWQGREVKECSANQSLMSREGNGDGGVGMSERVEFDRWPNSEVETDCG